MNPHIQLFFDMMQERYGVNGWKYDRNLNVQFTNSKSPNLQKLLLLGFGIVYTQFLRLFTHFLINHPILQIPDTVFGGDRHD